MQKLIGIIEDYDEEQRCKKAARHLEDAMYLRPIRHDIDGNQRLFDLN
jgi:hypothetical protein